MYKRLGYHIFIFFNVVIYKLTYICTRTVYELRLVVNFKFSLLYFVNNLDVQSVYEINKFPLLIVRRKKRVKISRILYIA